MNTDLSRKKTRYMQCIAATTAALLSACSNMTTSWSSPAIPQLTSNNSPIGTVLNSDEASWVASAPSLGFVVGSIAIAPLLNKFGPKVMLLFAALPIFFTWIVIAFVKSVWLLILMRFLSGIGNGIIFTVLPLYLSEVSDKDIRGGLTTTIYVLAALGNLFVLSVGPFVSYTVLSLSCAVVPLLFGIIFIFMPDSPYFLFKKGKTEASARALRRLLPKTVDEMTIKSRMLEIERTVAFESNKRSFTNYWFNKNFRLGLLLALGICCLKQLGGVTTLKSYLQTVIELTHTSISPETSSVIFGSVQVPSALLVAYLMDKLGRRPLYIFSTSICGIALIVVGLYFYFEENLHSISWLPTLGLTIYLIVSLIGLSTIPSVLLGELFASDVKSVAASICSTFYGILSFLLTKFFLPLSDEVGVHVTFWIFGGSCVVALLFGAVLLPETKGRTFLEIQDILRTRSCC